MRVLVEVPPIFDWPMALESQSQVAVVEPVAGLVALAVAVAALPLSTVVQARQLPEPLEHSRLAATVVHLTRAAHGVRQVRSSKVEPVVRAVASPAVAVVVAATSAVAVAVATPTLAAATVVVVVAVRHTRMPATLARSHTPRRQMQAPVRLPSPTLAALESTR